MLRFSKRVNFVFFTQYKSFSRELQYTQVTVVLEIFSFSSGEVEIQTTRRGGQPEPVLGAEHVP